MDALTKIVVLVSGGGTNLQALIDAQRTGILRSGRIVLVVSSSKNAYAVTRAQENGIPVEIIAKPEYPDLSAFETRLSALLSDYGAELIVFAGFMKILSPDFFRNCTIKMINIHPSLLPAFGGKGFYGLHVHEAALNYGVKLTGATVHYVNEVTDGGEIIAQKSVPVRKNDTPEKLQRRVMEQAEWKLLPRAAEKISREIMREKNRREKTQ